MRKTTWIRLSGIAMMASVAGCNLGDVGGEINVCEEAAAHVAACLGTAAPAVGTCGATESAQAEAALAKECSEMQGEAGTRQTTSLQSILCKVLPFLCPKSGGGTVMAAGFYRIHDCWAEPKGYCFDMVKLGAGGNCTEPMEHNEWSQGSNPKFTSAICLQQVGSRCRLARVCINVPDKGQCINQVPHHGDAKICQANAGQPGTPGGGGPGGGGPGGGGPGSGPTCQPNELLTTDNQCQPPSGVSMGGSCTSQGSAYGSLCQPGLQCCAQQPGGKQCIPHNVTVPTPSVIYRCE